ASRLSARNALISSPSNGCVLVCPPLALRRCRVPDANSTSDHCRPQSSEARRPCRLSPPVARRLSQGRRCASVACLLPCGNARCRYSKPEHGKGIIILQATTASDWTFLVIRRQDFDDSCHLLASRRLLEHAVAELQFGLRFVHFHFGQNLPAKHARWRPMRRSLLRKQPLASSSANWKNSLPSVSLG